jgi:hypothetical protein
VVEDRQKAVRQFDQAMKGEGMLKPVLKGMMLYKRRRENKGLVDGMMKGIP